MPSSIFDKPVEGVVFQPDGSRQSPKGFCPHCHEHIGRGVFGHAKYCLKGAVNE